MVDVWSASRNAFEVRGCLRALTNRGHLVSLYVVATIVNSGLGPESEVWRRLLLGTDPSVMTLRRRHRRIPSPPRCKMCAAPFGPPGGWVLRYFGHSRWAKNPKYCEGCFRTLQANHGGAEVNCSLVFADVRGRPAPRVCRQPLIDGLRRWCRQRTFGVTAGAFAGRRVLRPSRRTSDRQRDAGEGGCGRRRARSTIHGANRISNAAIWLSKFAVITNRSRASFRRSAAATSSGSTVETFSSALRTSGG